jgi:hypothetical protein
MDRINNFCGQNAKFLVLNLAVKIVFIHDERVDSTSVNETLDSRKKLICRKHELQWSELAEVRNTKISVAAALNLWVLLQKCESVIQLFI